MVNCCFEHLIPAEKPGEFVAESEAIQGRHQAADMAITPTALFLTCPDYSRLSAHKPSWMLFILSR